MSWDKNTINISEINAIIRTLEKLNTPYKVKVIDKLLGRGLNDDYYWEGVNSYHELRQLEYKDFIVLEQMIRATDCDIDDYIISKEFVKDKVPEIWETEITIDSETGKKLDTIKNYKPRENIT